MRRCSSTSSHPHIVHTTPHRHDSTQSRYSRSSKDERHRRHKHDIARMHANMQQRRREQLPGRGWCGGRREGGGGRPDGELMHSAHHHGTGGGAVCGVLGELRREARASGRASPTASPLRPHAGNLWRSPVASGDADGRDGTCSWGCDCCGGEGGHPGVTAADCSFCVHQRSSRPQAVAHWRPIRWAHVVSSGG